jgi:hypothetical protein
VPGDEKIRRFQKVLADGFGPRPKDPEPYNSIAFIDYIECVQRDGEEGAKLGLKPGEHPNPKDRDQKKVCDELKQRNSANIQDGIDALNKVLQLRPDDHRAMFWMFLMYLEKGSIECDDLTAREEDLKTAWAWNNKKDFGVPVKAKKSSFGDFDRPFYAACEATGSGESSGSGEPYDVAEAYEVYSAIVPSIDPDPTTLTWLIRIDTLPIGGGSSRTYDPSDPARGWKKAPGQTSVNTALDDHSKVNAKTWLLQRKFVLPNPYKLVTHEEIKAMFPPNPKEGFRELWLELSAVGFNADKTMAVVYMAHHCTTTCCCGDEKSFCFRSITASGRC